MARSEIASSLLVSMPQLQDPNFHRTVSLIVDHGDGGTFGLVLNREANVSASYLCAQLDIGWSGDPNAAVHWGGPVQEDTGWVVFQDETDGMSARSRGLGDELTEVIPGLFFASSFSVLRALADTPPEEVRLFLGYSGWGPGQIEMEMAEGAWLVAPASLDVVLHVSPDSMWDHVVRGLGVDPSTLVATRGIH